MVDRYRNYKPRARQAPPKTPWRGWPVLCLLLAVACVVIYFWRGQDAATNNQRTTNASAKAAKSTKPEIQVEPIASQEWTTLQQRIDTLVTENSSVDIAVTVIDIGTNTKVNYGVQEAFVAASTTKVLTATAFLHEVETGKRKLNTESKQLLKLMINQSNNDAWYTLNQRITYTQLEKYAAQIQLSSFKAKENIITASDAALLMQKLYRRELLNEEHTTLLLSYMQQTNNESMIPKAAPQDATLYHKYGQLEDRLHDIAIIDFQNRPIALAIYTKGGVETTANYTNRTALIRSITQAVIETIYKITPTPQT